MATKEDIEIEWFTMKILPELKKNSDFLNDDEKDFKIHKIKLSFIGAEEAFMLTICARVQIEFENNGKLQNRSLIVKKTPNLPKDLFESVQFTNLFQNEIETYTKILWEIDNSLGTKIKVPIYFYSEMKPDFCTIVLEDFTPTGWMLPKQRADLSLEHGLLALKYLAKFHAIGFAMRYLNKEHFDDMTKNLKESRFANEIHPTYKFMLKESLQRALNVTRKYQPKVDEKFLQKFYKLISNYMGYCRQRVKPIEPMVTLCHGDFLRNNLAFKYALVEENEEIPTDIMMFDLQTMRVCSPMIDVSIYLGLSTFAQTRYGNFELLFDTYTSELADAFVQYTKEELPDYLSHNELLKEYIRFLPFSMAVTPSFLMILVEPYNLNSEAYLTQNITEEERIKDIHARGGKIVDQEVAHQMKELYELSQKYDVDIFQGYEEVMSSLQ